MLNQNSGRRSSARHRILLNKLKIDPGEDGRLSQSHGMKREARADSPPAQFHSGGKIELFLLRDAPPWPSSVDILDCKTSPAISHVALRIAFTRKQQFCKITIATRRATSLQRASLTALLSAANSTPWAEKRNIRWVPPGRLPSIANPSLRLSQLRPRPKSKAWFNDGKPSRVESESSFSRPFSQSSS